MGEHVWEWFLPITGSQGDGVRFEYNEALSNKLKKRAREIAAGHTAQSSRPIPAQPEIPPAGSVDEAKESVA